MGWHRCPVGGRSPAEQALERRRRLGHEPAGDAPRPPCRPPGGHRVAIAAAISAGSAARVTAVATRTALHPSSMARQASEAVPMPASSTTGTPACSTMSSMLCGLRIPSPVPMGAPSAGGTYTITISATNSTGTTSQTFSLTVRQPPLITNASTASATHWDGLHLLLYGHWLPGADHGPRRHRCRAQLDQRYWHCHFERTPKTAGTYTLTITATNNSGKAVQTFTSLRLPNQPGKSALGSHPR